MDTKVEYIRNKGLLKIWLRRLGVERSSFTLLYSQRARWHIYLLVPEDCFEVVVSQIHTMPKITLKVRLDTGGFI